MDPATVLAVAGVAVYLAAVLALVLRMLRRPR